MASKYGLFPVEPDDDMLVAGQEALCVLKQEGTAIDDCQHAETVWKAMTAAAPTKSMTSVAQRIQELAEVHGSVKDVANYLGVNGVYLQRLANDSKTSPSEDVLKKLGLQRIVSYVRGI